MKSILDLKHVSKSFRMSEKRATFGSPFLAMPNLDRLCREGAVFGNHVSTSPICMPARASWVTGLYPHTHGLWDNIDHQVPKDGPFLMRDLQALGYLTAGITKGLLDTPTEFRGETIIHDRTANYSLRSL